MAKTQQMSVRVTESHRQFLRRLLEREQARVGNVCRVTEGDIVRLILDRAMVEMDGAAGESK